MSEGRDNAQFQQHMTKQLESATKENRILQLKLEELEKERQALEEQRKLQEDEKQKVLEERQALEQRLNEASALAENFKQKERLNVEQALNTNITPYLDRIAESNKDNTELIQSINKFKEKTAHDLETGDFIRDDRKDNLMVISAMASAAQVTSSELDKIFQARKEWEKQMEALKTEKEELNSKFNVETEENKKIIEQLRKELEAARSDIKNTATHFEESEKVTPQETPADPAPVPMETTPAISAVASNDSAKGYKSLYQVGRINGWATMASRDTNSMLDFKQDK